MATTVRRLSNDDLDSISQEREGDRHELIDGELIVTPAATPFHQDIARNIALRLAMHVQARNLGTIYFAPVDVRLTPDIVLNPDIIFIAKDRQHMIGPKAVDAAPDLVVEILSPRTRQRDLGVKRDLYARFGVQEYWIVDPDARTLSILALHGDQFRESVGCEAGVYTSCVLPELKIPLGEVFASAYDR